VHRNNYYGFFLDNIEFGGEDDSNVLFL